MAACKPAGRLLESRWPADLEEPSNEPTTHYRPCHWRAGISGIERRVSRPPASADLIRARQLFFGIENVDTTTGAVDNQKIIFSWITNASYAVSLKGRIVLLDTYVHRGETQSGRTPFVVKDLVSLQPEAIFLGHGHFDHADNAAFVAGNLGVPIFPALNRLVASVCIATHVSADA
jgi:hypothetical protein